MKLHIKATPNARTSEIIGWQEDPMFGRVLRVRIAAPATEGKANAALQAFLANRLGIPKSQLVLEKGGKSRVKTFSLPDDTKLPG